MRLPKRGSLCSGRPCFDQLPDLLRFFWHHRSIDGRARSCCRPLRIRCRHRLNRQWGLFQSPRLSGKSRQGLPVRWQWSTASTKRRLSATVTPTEPAPQKTVLGAAPHSHRDDDLLDDAPRTLRFASQRSRNHWTVASSCSRCSTGARWPASHHRAGPVGRAHARSLADGGLRIGLVERQPRTEQDHAL